MVCVGSSRAGDARANRVLETAMTEPETFLFEDDGAIPNSRLPLLVYRSALPADPVAIEKTFAANRWPPVWRDAVHPFHHFHGNTHEALGVASGEATVLFGGPNGRVLRISAGDIVIIPAGVGHCNQSQSPDLLIVGAYPENAPKPDQYHAIPSEHDAAARKVAATPPPTADPVTGGDGPLRRLWGAVAA
jgi:uncharacterized protein YjlB